MSFSTEIVLIEPLHSTASSSNSHITKVILSYNPGNFNPSLAEHDSHVLVNNVDPDQLASEEAN